MFRRALIAAVSIAGLVLVVPAGASASQPVKTIWVRHDSSGPPAWVGAGDRCCEEQVIQTYGDYDLGANWYNFNPRIPYIRFDQGTANYNLYVGPESWLDSLRIPAPESQGGCGCPAYHTEGTQGSTGRSGPYGVVQTGIGYDDRRMETFFSHEVWEMAVDPNPNTSPYKLDGRLVEVSDPVACYKNDFSDYDSYNHQYWMSDFTLPSNWIDGGRYPFDYSGRLTSQTYGNNTCL